MRHIVIPGGSGHVGQMVRRAFIDAGWKVTVLSRRADTQEGSVPWDGENLGPWTESLEGADVVLNLAGRSVNCRYNEANLREMMESRVRSTRVLGQAIARAANPPKVWLQASTATLYAHRFDAANDEATGIIGGQEPGVPALWKKSIDIAVAWEKELIDAPTPNTRKVALRSAITMSNDAGSAFDIMAKLAKLGLGGTVGNGRQFVSWIHGEDFCRALQFLIDETAMDGPVNIVSPHPMPNRDFSKILRKAVHAPFGLPTPAPLLEIGTFLMKTESELVVKSRRVVPMRLLEAGFKFKFPDWESACRDLVMRRHG